MYALYLGDAQHNDRLYLHGPGVAAPVRGAVRQVELVRLADGCVEEVITVECKAGDIPALLTRLELRLALLENGIQPWYLWLEARAGSTPLGASLRRGRVETIGGGTVDRLHGFMGLRLRLVRPDWLAELPAPLKLNNANGVDVTDGLMVMNHADGGSGHVNTCDIRAETIGGSQPQPVRWMLDVGGAVTRRLGKIVVSGGMDLWDATGAFDHVLEGESSSPGAGCTATTAVSNLSASGGVYQSFQWTAVTESPVFRWTVNSERLAWLKGRGVRPVARLHTPPPPNTRLRWKLLSADGATQLDVSALAKLDPASRLQVLPAMFPPVPGSTTPFQEFILEAWLECVAAGVKQIELDFIHLFPLENFVLFQPVSGIDQNHSLVMDWVSGECYAQAESDGAKSVTHLASGSPMLLYPGRNHRLYVLYESDAGFGIGDTVNVRVEAGARWLHP